MAMKHRFEPIGLAAGILLALTAVLNSVSLFLLPRSLSAVFSAQRVSTVSFLVGGVLLVGVCGVMAVFGPRPKKWIAMESVLAVCNIALVVFNLIRQ